jgi:hypothetical protein
MAKQNKTRRSTNWSAQRTRSPQPTLASYNKDKAPYAA